MWCRKAPTYRHPCNMRYTSTYCSRGRSARRSSPTRTALQTQGALARQHHVCRRPPEQQQHEVVWLLCCMPGSDTLPHAHPCPPTWCLAGQQPYLKLYSRPAHTSLPAGWGLGVEAMPPASLQHLQARRRRRATRGWQGPPKLGPAARGGHVPASRKALQGSELYPPHAGSLHSKGEEVLLAVAPCGGIHLHTVPGANQQRDPARLPCGGVRICIRAGIRAGVGRIAIPTLAPGRQAPEPHTAWRPRGPGRQHSIWNLQHAPTGSTHRVQPTRLHLTHEACSGAHLPLWLPRLEGKGAPPGWYTVPHPLQRGRQRLPGLKQGGQLLHRPNACLGKGRELPWLEWLAVR